MSHFKPRVCVDFDGVLNDYTGWTGEDDLAGVAPGAPSFLFQLMQAGYEIVILTTGPQERVWEWLRLHEIDGLVDDVTSVKPPAFAYVDDRAICYRGDFAQTLAALDGFKAHWEPSK